METENNRGSESRRALLFYYGVVLLWLEVRADSKTYGKWFGVVLTAENKKQFYIPEGFAHGFLVLSDEAEFAYKCTDFYHPGDEGGLAWNDPEIGIDWPLEAGVELIISEKDQKWSGLKDTFRFR